MTELTLYALSTCIWCRKTKHYLDEARIRYRAVMVDELQGEAREQALRELERFNPRRSFPTLVFGDGEQVVVGYNPDEIRSALEARAR